VKLCFVQSSTHTSNVIIIDDVEETKFITPIATTSAATYAVSPTSSGPRPTLSRASTEELIEEKEMKIERYDALDDDIAIFSDEEGQEKAQTANPQQIDWERERALTAEIDDIEKVIAANFTEFFMDDLDQSSSNAPATPPPLTSTRPQPAHTDNTKSMTRSKSEGGIITNFFTKITDAVGVPKLAVRSFQNFFSFTILPPICQKLLFFK